MFYNMCFTDVELSFLFTESSSKRIDSNIYEINGFQIRFFTKEEIESFLAKYFEIKKNQEGYEEPASLYFVSCYKK